MNFKVIEFRSQFTGWDELNPEGLASCPHPGAAFHGIVIGERHCLEPAALRFVRQIFRGIGPIRKVGVKVKVGELVFYDFYLNQIFRVSYGVLFTSRAGRIKSLFTRSRIPFTNLPLSWVENFFAISTASLMLTTGGMSSRCSIS